MKTSFKHAAQAAGLAMMGLLAPISGHAFVIDSSTATGSVFTVNYLLNLNGTDGNGNLNDVQNLSASIVFTLLSYNTGTNTIDLQLNVTNTSALLGNNVGLNKFAFGTDPDAISASLLQMDTLTDVDKFVSATWENPQTNAPEISPELTLGNTFVLDVESDTGNGYANGTLNEGKLDVFTLSIGFSSLSTSGVTFSPFSTKFQTGSESFEFAGSECTTNCGGGGPGGDPVPEPGIVALMGIGLLGMSLARKRISA